MQHSRLSTLPPELRTEIFARALTSPSPIELRYTRRLASRPRPWRLHAPPHAVALMQTCGAIRAECGDAFYRLNAFALGGLETGEMLEGLDALVWCVGVAGFARIERIAVLPVELDCVSFWPGDLPTSLERLPVALARLRWARDSLGVEVVTLQCSVVYWAHDGEHTLRLAFDVEQLAWSWRLVVWEMMGEMLAHPDHETLLEICEVLHRCGEQLTHMGLLPKG